ncbi:hypothetical protein NP493_2g24087 [Ridgeia piscesae]|uniref:Uncharacterized protein n=1 Tax=Ridgeia piscesae TaxID=27915 RepID=A0AAD9ULV8_RIDPI|nr:hypothetical protein NP493_8824g00002 [Ridgeia piscesae]KAK2194201.1 hypothetical protein NP493_2g24087 [Ridgeia piscesae]
MYTAMTSCGRLFVFILVGATFVDESSAHVRLTYPPAREFALDFLDNVRTDPPCGMEAGHGMVTDLEEAATFNVSWHMAYVHNGGYKIEVLEGSTVKHTLTPGKDFVGSSDTT